jgi:prepilin-type N-terminal cleavage/methylation domain-containing protein
MKPQKGFSLIEVLIVVAVAASLVIVASNFSGNVSGLNTLISQQLQSKSDTNQTLQIMTSEIRSAGPSQNGAYPIDSASTSSFAFYSDINKNGLTEHVRYFLSSSTIYKGVIAPTGTPATYPTSSEIITDVIDDVTVPTSSPLFTYYDDSYTGTQAPLATPVNVSTIRIIGISFLATAAAANPQQPKSIQSFSMLVAIRNLRDN